LIPLPRLLRSYLWLISGLTILLKKIPWLSLIILLLTYSAFGWMYSFWAVKLIEEGRLLSQLETELALRLIYGFGTILIMLVALIFTAPISLITVSLNSWLKSDIITFLSIFIAAFAFTLVVQRVDYFVEFLLLLAAALLVKLDLQLAGYQKWLSWSIVTFFGLLGFIGGILAYDKWGSLEIWVTKHYSAF
jgi:uncharacterized protein YacL